ncbi:MAG TPA: universal stress protein [Polyangiaceae bacterium]
MPLEDPEHSLWYGPPEVAVTPIQKVLCPVDCSEGSKVALEYALFVGNKFGAKVHVLHAWHVAHHVRPDLSVWMEAHGQQPISKMIALEAKAETDRFLAALDPAVRNELEAHVVEGEPASTIVGFATDHQVDLIVMGTHGRTGVVHLALGSVAEKVVRHALCPVLTVRIPKKS